MTDGRTGERGIQATNRSVENELSRGSNLKSRRLRIVEMKLRESSTNYRYPRDILRYYNMDHGRTNRTVCNGVRGGSALKASSQLRVRNPREMYLLVIAAERRTDLNNARETSNL